jgi:hypothetical protein
MTDCGELRWFLGIYILRDRRARSIWLSQESYFEKIVRECQANIDGRLPETPMDEKELLLSNGKATASSTTRYQKKVGSILFSAVTTRPDIAFAAARLSQFCQNPDETHQAAADRVIRYLYSTRDRAYGLMARIKVQPLSCVLVTRPLQTTHWTVRAHRATFYAIWRCSSLESE